MNRILIVEDEITISRLIAVSLRRAGYDCTVANDGSTAADLIAEHDFDLALLDIMLPGLDGYELLGYLRPLGVPVIFITAKGATKDRVRGLQLGADDYIVKPFEIEELLARVEAVLRRTGRGGQTLTAAIGQSYDLFTPLQLANYIATLVGSGQHYEAHLLKNVKSYDNSSVIYAYDKAPLNTVEMSDSTVQAVKEGMHNLTTGSLSYYFSNCVVSAGAKTGTAETGIANTNNGVFVCFAPYDDPQIAVAVVIEKGGSGAALASTAVDIVNSYFSQEEIGAVVIGENTLLK